MSLVLTVLEAQDDPELTETFPLLNAVIVNVCTVPSSRRMTAVPSAVHCLSAASLWCGTTEKSVNAFPLLLTSHHSLPILLLLSLILPAFLLAYVYECLPACMYVYYTHG